MARKTDTSILCKVPKPHGWLSEGAKKHYDEIVPLLIGEGVVKYKDIPLLESACELFAIWRGENGEPFAIRKSALQQYQKIMTEYGVTYKASKQLALLDKQDKKDEVDERYKGLFDD